MLEFINFLGQYIFTFILHICGNGKFPKPLSEDKEKEYLLKSKNGDIKARNILVEHNLRLLEEMIFSCQRSVKRSFPIARKKALSPIPNGRGCFLSLFSKFFYFFEKS